MKRIGYTFIFILLTFFAFSQGPVNIGLKFGTNSSTMVTDIDEVLNQNIEENSVNNYLAGVFARVSIGRLYAQPEAYFNTKGGIINPIGNDQFKIPTETLFNYQTIDVPVLIGFKLLNRNLVNLRMHTGPVFSYITANSLRSEITDLNAEDLNNRYVGWQIGVGIDIWFLTIDARIENSSNILIANSNYSARNRVYLLSAGIKLF